MHSAESKGGSVVRPLRRCNVVTGVGAGRECARAMRAPALARTLPFWNRSAVTAIKNLFLQ